MKDITIKLLTVLTVVCSAATVIRAQHPSVVNSYYASIQRLATSTPGEAFDLTNLIMYCFAGKDRNDPTSGFSGIDVVDNLTSNHSDTIPSNVFAQRLKRAINEQKTLRLDSYNLLTSHYSKQPKMTEDGEVLLCQTKVEAAYLDKNAITHKRDEYLGIVENKIVSISLKEMNMDVVGLTFEAARLFTMNKFQDAYNTYKKILEIEPENMNALYRLGVMTAKGLGTKKNYKEAKKLFEKAKSLIKKSKSDQMFDFYKLREKAEDALYYLTKPSVV